MCCCHGYHHCYGAWYWDEPYPPTEEGVGERESRYRLERKVLSLEKELEELKKKGLEGRS